MTASVRYLQSLKTLQNCFRGGGFPLIGRFRYIPILPFPNVPVSCGRSATLSREAKAEDSFWPLNMQLLLQEKIGHSLDAMKELHEELPRLQKIASVKSKRF